MTHQHRSIPIALIVAAADNDVIGNANALPWNLPADLAHFKRKTLGKPVLMGRRTFESIGRPLPGRPNIVITRDPEYSNDGIRVAGSVERALELAEELALAGGSEELMVIGGEQIYALTLPFASRLYLTRVHATPGGDARLPPVVWPEWAEVSSEKKPAEDGRPPYTFLEYTRKTSRNL